MRAGNQHRSVLGWKSWKDFHIALFWRGRILRVACSLIRTRIRTCLNSASGARGTWRQFRREMSKKSKQGKMSVTLGARQCVNGSIGTAKQRFFNIVPALRMRVSSWPRMGLGQPTMTCWALLLPLVARLSGLGLRLKHALDSMSCLTATPFSPVGC
jgi:hypothetical protein